MIANDALTAASTWRPQLFGDRRATNVVNPIVEPLWTGPRILAYVSREETRFSDIDGDPIEGLDDIRAQLVTAATGSTLLLEAALTPEPLQGPADLAARETVPMPKTSTFMTTLMVGDVPVALVAVDLLWLDDESICDVPLLERRRLLEAVLTESQLVRVGLFVKPPIDRWLGGWRSAGFSRLAFKGENSRYVPGAKNPEWSTAEIPHR